MVNQRQHLSLTPENDRLFLVGFRIDPDVYDPQLYTLYVNDDRPIMLQGQPILFTRPELASTALQRSDCGASVLSPPTELYAVYDITKAIYVLDSYDTLPDAELLNCVNLLLDCVNCIGENMPTPYRETLEKLADHLTFSRDLSQFLAKHRIERQSILDAVYWCLGLVTYQMKVIV